MKSLLPALLLCLISHGFAQQAELFQRVRDTTGRTPPVLDSRDVLTDPRRQLTLLCQALDIPFTGSMLAWPPGRRDTDGVWAPHWYHAVEGSTGFQPYKHATVHLDGKMARLAAACQPHYDALYAHRLGA